MIGQERQHNIKELLTPQGKFTLKYFIEVCICGFFCFSSPCSTPQGARSGVQALCRMRSHKSQRGEDRDTEPSP